MLTNFLKVAFRNLLKRKIYSAINIFGLSIGLTATLIIYLFVRYEYSYDDFHPRADNIFRIVRQHTIGDQTSSIARINYSFAALAKENIPFVENVAQVGSYGGLISLPDLSKEFEEEEILFADRNFFRLFHCEFVAGDPETALNEPFSVVLTRSAAEKYFGNDNPVGKILQHDREKSFQVTAVVEDWPATSHMKWDMLFSISSTSSWYSENMFTHWGNVWVFTYALVTPGTTNEEVDAEVNRVAYQFGPDALESLDVRFSSQPLTSIHLESNLGGEMQTNGSKIFVLIFSAVGIMILLIASFNFINLATARASWRAKEVGLRKVVGAHKSSLVFQFLGESLFLTLISFAIAVLLTGLSLPVFNDYSGKELLMADLLSLESVGIVLCILIVIGIGAGCFPAFLLSSFRPINVLKGNTNLGNSTLANNLRKVLVILQFAVSIALVVSSFTIYQQLQYARNISLGFDEEHVVILDLYKKELQEQVGVLKNSLEKLSSVLSMTRVSDTPPTTLNSWWMDGRGELAGLHELMPVLAVDHDFVKTMGIRLVAGRDFDEDVPTDEQSAILINETAVKFLGLEDPIGQNFALGPDLKPNVNVIGVMEDFHVSSIHEKIKPVVVHIWPSWYDQLLIRLPAGDYERSLEDIGRVWDQILPQWNMEFHFLDSDFDRAYTAETSLGKLIFSFSLLALIIGLLGLFGLANYLAEQKTKEIGIRKVLGATVGQVVWLQYRSFTSLLLFSFLIAVPSAIYFLNDWLDQFAYRIDLQWWLFLAGGLLTFVISIGTVSMQSVQAALQNPVNSLRNE